MLKLVDLHEDFAVTSQTVDVRKDSKQSSVETLKNLGDCLIFSVLFPHINTWDEKTEYLTKKYGFVTHSTQPLLQVLIEQLKFYLYLERTGWVSLIRKKEDLNRQGTKFLLAMEGVDVLSDPYDAYLLKQLNVYSVGLTWNYDNKFAASCMSKKDYGLTGYGEELVQLCNKLGMLVDLAHASKQTIIDTANASKKPVIVSHTNAKKLRDHVRNLDDDCIEAVVKTGGIIGVTAIPNTLSENANISDIVRHANYIGENFGWKHVALGTDFLGIDTTPKDFEDVSKVAKLRELLGPHAEDVLWKNAYEILQKTVE
jgi:membrane dipeptidase